MAVIPQGPVGKAPIAAARTIGAATTVTLISGDQVRVDAQGHVRSITPGTGRQSVLFTQTKSGSDAIVMPSDAVSLVQRGVVDPRLFNVSLLVRYGYDDAKRSTTPTIARGFDAGGGASTMRAAGMQAPRALGAVRGFSGGVDKRGTQSFWNLVKQRGAGVQRTARFGPRLWLDGQRQILIDKSVPQIGGDVAWAAGYTGTGITVAVLDTGIDATHPDFAGRLASLQNFTTDPDTKDYVGHGTHVSSTIAGNGAASGGKYRGVAPDATLAIGKVCTQVGCADSDILAGMQWAAVTVHARVVNMSLGGTGTPDIDPIEEAVGTLSASNGTLFVVAAGNSGCPAGGGTVSSPSTADAALSVGAVDRSAQMASFSSCGPRQGDGAVKPEITGPGVDIVAARSSTGEFPPTDPTGFYTTLSGTSMATPHVAGSAVLVAQQHPGWSGADIKGLLIATAASSNPAGIYSQGAGFVNVGRAVQRSWYDSSANLSFGLQLWPHSDDPLLVKQLTLHNIGTQPVNLTLQAQAKSTTGVAAPPGMFYLSTNQVTVPAGGSTNVSLTADTRVNVADGTYAGTVTISDGQAQSTTLFSVIKEVESYDLTLTHLDANGQPSTAYQTTIDGLDLNMEVLAPASDNGQVTVRLPKGHYRVMSVFPVAPRIDVLGLPSFNLDRTSALTISAQRTALWQVTVPDLAAQAFVRYFEAVNWLLPFGETVYVGYSFDPTAQIRFGRIDTPRSAGPVKNFAFNAEIEMGRVDSSGQADPTYPIAYIVDSTRESMPTGLRKVYGPNDLARVKHILPKTSSLGQAASEILPELNGGGGYFAGLFLPNAHDTIEYLLNAGPYLRWSSEMYWQSVQSYNQVILASPASTYAPGSQTTIDWTSPRPYSTSLNSSYVVFDYGATPDLVLGDPGSKLATGLRRGIGNGQDVIAFAQQPLGDAAGNAGRLSSFDLNAVVLSLSRAGTLIYSADVSGATGIEVPVPSDTSTYTLTEALVTPVEFGGSFGLPVSMKTDWTFVSGPASPNAWSTLPMSVVHLGKLARSASGGWHIPLHVVRQATGAPVPDDVQSLTVELSADGGSSWKPATLVGAGSDWSAAVPLNTFANRSVSVRTVAVSKDGAQVQQTVIGAYSAAVLP